MTKTWFQSFGLSGAVGDDLEGVVGPLVDDVGGDLAAFDPEVPAPVVVAVVHPRDDRAAEVALDGLDPGPVGERLVLLEVAGVGQLELAGRRSWLWRSRRGRRAGPELQAVGRGSWPASAAGGRRRRATCRTRAGRPASAVLDLLA